MLYFDGFLKAERGGLYRGLICNADMLYVVGTRHACRCGVVGVLCLDIEM